MKYNELNASKSKSSRRVGRGIASGRGKTAGRGTKGYGSRTGSKRRPGFEGGQNPLMQRLPKLRGFKSFKTAPETVYTGDLKDVKGTVTTTSLFEAGLISSPNVRVKLVVRGEVEGKHTVKLQAASATAIAKIQQAGGTFEVVEQLMRPAKTTEES